VTKIVHARWEGGMRFSSADEFGGTATMEGTDGVDGYRPTALLLGALAGCTAIDVISILGKKRQQVERYDVHVTGQTVPTHPKMFHSIVVEHELRGPGLDVEAVRRAVELSAVRYCPITAQLSSGDVRISHRYLVHDEIGTDRAAEVVVTGPHGAGLEPVKISP
jgi:putative redox protein